MGSEMCIRDSTKEERNWIKCQLLESQTGEGFIIKPVRDHFLPNNLFKKVRE